MKNVSLFTFLRLQDEIGLRQDAEHNLNAFRQVNLFDLKREIVY